MITYVSGGFFSSPAQVLVNPINTVGMMGRGLAREFRLGFPEMFEQYQRYCRNKELAPGVLHFHRSPGKSVLNLPTKRHWKPASKLESIEAGLRTFVDHADDMGIQSVSFPQLGCGTGGLDWEGEVRPVMERALDPLPLVIHVHIQGGSDNTGTSEPFESAVGLAAQPIVLSRERLACDLESVNAGISSGTIERIAGLLASGQYLSRRSLPESHGEDIRKLLTSLGTLPYMRRTSGYERPALDRRIGALHLDPRHVVEGEPIPHVVEDMLIWPQVPSAMRLAI